MDDDRGYLWNTSVFFSKKTGRAVGGVSIWAMCQSRIIQFFHDESFTSEFRNKIEQTSLELHILSQFLYNSDLDFFLYFSDCGFLFEFVKNRNKDHY